MREKVEAETGARRRRSCDIAGYLRCGLALLSVVAGISEGSTTQVLPWALGVMLLELAGLRVRTPAARLQVLVAQAVIVAGAVVVTLPEHRALLPLLLVPAFRAGQLHGLRVALITSGVLAVVPIVTVTVQPGWSAMVAALHWGSLAVALAVLGAWTDRLERDRREPAGAIAREAGALLGRLQDLARALPAGFDAPAIAEMLADAAVAAAPAERAAVLVHVGPDEVSPVVVRGVERLPWRDPVNEPGTAHAAWTRRATVHDVRLPEVGGRRRGSAMLAVPIADRDDELLGMLILERLAPAGFTAKEIQAIEDAVHEAASRLHAALAFLQLRTLSEVAERERLAREMHDGVAQDLVVVGFGIDAVQRRLRSVDPELASALQEVRGHVSSTIRDIRYSIADLRSSVRSDRGLGAALSSASQSLGPATGAEVTLSLKESPFRLPAHVESAFLRLAQDFFGHVRAGAGVAAVEVSFESAPPAARLELRHDGNRAWEPEDGLLNGLTQVGGTAHCWVADGVWVCVLEVGRRPLINLDALFVHNEKLLEVGRA